MTAKVDQYRKELRDCADWPAYLKANSHLPGPRGNLELAEAVYLEGSRDLFTSLIADDSPEILENTPGVFAVFCGILGLGRLLGEGELKWLPTLRAYANDPRWRVREAVAMALQKFGGADLNGLLAQMREWAEGSLLEQRAVVAALCEPALLFNPAVVKAVLEILDRITEALSRAQERKGDDLRALRQTLGYGWSVVAAADMAQGKAAMERWFASPDPYVRWVMRENLKKKRLERADTVWVEKWKGL